MSETSYSLRIIGSRENEFSVGPEHMAWLRANYPGCPLDEHGEASFADWPEEAEAMKALSLAFAGTTFALYAHEYMPGTECVQYFWRGDSQLFWAQVTYPPPNF